MGELYYSSCLQNLGGNPSTLIVVYLEQTVLMFVHPTAENHGLILKNC